MGHHIQKILLATIVVLVCLAPASHVLAIEPPSGLALAEDSGSLLAAIGKVVGSLAVVVGLMLLLLTWIRKMGLGKIEGRPGSLIRILDTRLVAPKKYVAVLQVPGERIVVGITDQQINFLTSLGTEPQQEELPGNGEGAPPQAPFASLLKKAAGRLTRKNDKPERNDSL